MIETEIWKDVLDYKGLYQVSNFGRVKSLARKGRLEDKILIPQKNNCGYFQVCLCKNGKQTHKRVHVLVWEAFNGKVPKGMQVDHKVEGDKSNNALSNLQLATNRQNVTKHYLSCKTSSQYTGVYWHKAANKWLAQIKIGEKNKYLGLFINEIDAHNAYQKALKEHNEKIYCESTPSTGY